MLINTKLNIGKRDKQELKTSGKTELIRGAQTNKRWTCAIRYFFVILQRGIVVLEYDS